VGLLTSIKMEALTPALDEIGKMLRGLIRSLQEER
jgi:hypothetical protein